MLFFILLNASYCMSVESTKYFLENVEVYYSLLIISLIAAFLFDLNIFKNYE